MNNTLTNQHFDRLVLSEVEMLSVNKINKKMAYNERLASRIRAQLDFFEETFTEKRMFGGLCFLYEGKMTVGIVKEDLAVRIKSEKMEEHMAKDFVRPMDFTKRPMKEFVYVSPEGFDTEAELLQWIELGLEHAKYKLGQ